MIQAQAYMNAVLENDTDTLSAIAQGSCDFATVAKATLEQFGQNDNAMSASQKARKSLIPN